MSTLTLLYGFCDASKKACAAFVYLVTQTVSSVCVKFVLSMTRVSPWRELTIQHFELLSALLLVRILSQTACILVLISANPGVMLTPKLPYIRSLVEADNGSSLSRIVCPRFANYSRLTARDIALDATIMQISLFGVWISQSSLLANCGIVALSGWEGIRRATSLSRRCPQTLSMRCGPRIRKPVLIIGNNFASVEEIISCEKFSTLAHLLSMTASVLKFIWVLKQAVKGHHSRYLDDNLQAFADPELTTEAE